MEQYRITGDPEKEFTIALDREKDAFIAAVANIKENTGSCIINGSVGDISMLIQSFISRMTPSPVLFMYALFLTSYYSIGKENLSGCDFQRVLNELNILVNTLEKRSHELFEKTGVIPLQLTFREFSLFLKKITEAQKYLCEASALKTGKEINVKWDTVSGVLRSTGVRVLSIDRSKHDYFVLYMNTKDEDSPAEYYQQTNYVNLLIPLLESVIKESPLASTFFATAVYMAFSRIVVSNFLLYKHYGAYHIINNVYKMRIAKSGAELRCYLLKNSYVNKHRRLGSLVFHIGLCFIYIKDLFTLRIVPARKPKDV
jgi:hypothetical protein